MEKSALVSYVWEMGHKISFQDTTVLNKSSTWGTKMIMEFLEIFLCTDIINKEDGARLNSAYLPALDLLKSELKTVDIPL